MKVETMTPHAAKRAVEMALTPEVIKALINQPEKIILSRNEGESLYQRGRYVAVVRENYVLTFLYRTEKDGLRWDRDDISLCRD